MTNILLFFCEVIICIGLIELALLITVCLIMGIKDILN